MADKPPKSLLILACVRDVAEAALAVAAGWSGTVGPHGCGDVTGWTATDADGTAVFMLAEGDDLSRWCIMSDPGADDVPIETLADDGWDGVLIGSAARLLASASVPFLVALAERCRVAGLRVAFSGGLEPPDVPRLAAIGADVLVIGRAIRDGSGLDPVRLRAFAALVGPVGSPPAVIAATARPDRIFVRDLVCAIRIGAYGSEHGRPQRVRFNVEADVTPLPRVVEAMADVVSYDLITDAIARLTSGRHVAFAETLAEDIAAAVLAEPRVTLVRVQLEKLDLGTHVVGVEIERRRA